MKYALVGGGIVGLLVFLLIAMPVLAVIGMILWMMIDVLIWGAQNM